MAVLFSKETKAVIEGLLFVAKEPITLKQLSDIIGIPADDVLSLLDELKEDYNNGPRGMQISEIARGFQMFTRPELAPYIEKLYKPNNSHGLSKAALETLAIVAYKQPITRGEVEVIRGVKVDSSLGSLLEKNLVKEVGRKDAVGRPMLFGTTDRFLQYFGLKDITELPDPQEFLSQLVAKESMEEAAIGIEQMDGNESVSDKEQVQIQDSEPITDNDSEEPETVQ